MLAVKIQESATELVGPSTDCCKLALGVIPRDLLDQSSGSSTRNYARQALVVHKLYAPHLRHDCPCCGLDGWLFLCAALHPVCVVLHNPLRQHGDLPMSLLY